MHTSSIIALALAFGATAVSAAAFPNPQAAQPQTCTGQFCQFPKTIDCPVENGTGIPKEALEQAVKDASRDGQPYELQALNLGLRNCRTQNFLDIPLWTVSFFLQQKRWAACPLFFSFTVTSYIDFNTLQASIPRSTPQRSLGTLFYALAPNGTFYFCSTSSGSTPSGYPDSCSENY